MSNEPHKVAILGATGNVGTELIKILRSHKDAGRIASIRIVTNRPDHEALVAAQKHATTDITVIKGNYINDRESVMKAMEGCDRVFVALPQSLSSGGMVTAGRFLADCAKQTPSVRCIIRISSYGIDEHSFHYVQSQGPLGDAHVAIEQYCREECHLHVVSVRPTSFFSNLHFNMDEIRSNGTMSTPLGYDASVNWVSPIDISAVVANCLTSSTLVAPALASGSDGQLTVMDVPGPKQNTLSGPETASLLTQHLSKDDVANDAGTDAAAANAMPIECVEVPVPDSSDYAGLWSFLRAGGFDVDVDAFQRREETSDKAHSQFRADSGVLFSDFIKDAFGMTKPSSI